MLTVVTLMYRGSRGYTPEHVSNLRRQFEKHLTLPHRFVCVSDDPTVDGYHPLWDLPPVKCPRKAPFGATHKSWNGNYVKLGVFGAPGRELGDRLLLIDIDTCIRANIDDLFDSTAPIKALRVRELPHLQSGMVLLDAGCRPDIWEAAHDQEFVDAAFTKHRGTDQSVMSALLWDDMLAGKVPLWTEADGIAVAEPIRGWRMFHGAGVIKPWHEGHPVRAIYEAESRAS